MLEIKNLNVSLSESKHRLLHDINVNIRAGERVLLAGHNGSGKSTLANTIAGNPAYTTDSGPIFFNNSNVFTLISPLYQLMI